jgi:hypothetical protein
MRYVSVFFLVLAFFLLGLSASNYVCGPTSVLCD